MQDWTGRFEAERPRLRALAIRMLGSPADADDALQEAWVRVDRAGTDDVDNPAAWLTTVVSRVCLTMLQARRRHDTAELSGDLPDRVPGPEAAAELTDAVGTALAVVLERLGPAERVAFVLHDLFAVPFDDVAVVLDRAPAAARQLASRARRRVQGADPGAVDTQQHREVVHAFLAASRAGQFDRLLELLAPDSELRPDAAAAAIGAPTGVRGAQAVAEVFSGRAKALRSATVDGVPALVWAHRGVAQVVFELLVLDGRVVAVEQTADREYLDGMRIVYDRERIR